MKSIVITGLIFFLLEVNGQIQGNQQGFQQQPGTGPTTKPTADYGPIQNLFNPFLTTFQGVVDGILGGTRSVLLVPVNMVSVAQRTMNGVMNSFTRPNYDPPPSSENLWEILNKITQNQMNPGQANTQQQPFQQQQQQNQNFQG